MSRIVPNEPRSSVLQPLYSDGLASRELGSETGLATSVANGRHARVRHSILHSRGRTLIRKGAVTITPHNKKFRLEISKQLAHKNTNPFMSSKHFMEWQPSRSNNNNSLKMKSELELRGVD